MEIKLSAVIITLDEEKNIERCLQSLHGIVDEIVVIDSFSIDSTEEICKSLGAKFIQRQFEGYATQKNFALQSAKFDFVLSLDADEALSDELRKSVLEAKLNWKADGYFFNRLTNYCGQWIRHCGWYPDRKLRLLDRRKGSWGGGEVHEKIMMRKDSSTQFLKGDLLHYSYYTTSEHLQQQKHFTELAVREDSKIGRRSTLFHVILNPLYTFIRKYFFQLGFLDGYYGLVICLISARANYWKYSKLRQSANLFL